MDAITVNMVRYMPVEEATPKCMSSLSIIGVKTTPGPNPTAVAKRAPQNPSMMSLVLV